MQWWAVYFVGYGCVSWSGLSAAKAPPASSVEIHFTSPAPDCSLVLTISKLNKSTIKASFLVGAGMALSIRSYTLWSACGNTEVQMWSELWPPVLGEECHSGRTVHDWKYVDTHTSDMVKTEHVIWKQWALFCCCNRLDDFAHYFRVWLYRIKFYYDTISPWFVWLFLLLSLAYRITLKDPYIHLQERQLLTTARQLCQFERLSVKLASVEVSDETWWEVVPKIPDEDASQRLKGNVILDLTLCCRKGAYHKCWHAVGKKLLLDASLYAVAVRLKIYKEHAVRVRAAMLFFFGKLQMRFPRLMIT